MPSRRPGLGIPLSVPGPAGEAPRKGGKLPDYKVRVTYEYPVSAINAKDALGTISIAIASRVVCTAQGTAEVIRTEDNKVVLTAQLKKGDI